MIARSCSFQNELDAALRDGALPEHLKTHSQRCERCSVTAHTSELLLRLDAVSVVPTPPTDAEMLWWRSRALKRFVQRSRRRERRPTRTISLLASVLPLLAIVTAIGWSSVDFLRHVDSSLPLWAGLAALIVTIGSTWLTFWLADESLAAV